MKLENTIIKFIWKFKSSIRKTKETPTKQSSTGVVKQQGGETTRILEDVMTDIHHQLDYKSS